MFFLRDGIFYLRDHVGERKKKGQKINQKLNPANFDWTCSSNFLKYIFNIFSV